MDRRLTVINGAAVEYAVVGSGTPAIVLLNGAGGPLEGWFRFLAPLEVIARAGTLPPVPVVVVSGGKPARSVPAAVRDARARNQAGFVARKSGHFLQMSEPGLVSEATRSLVAPVRESNG